MFLYKREINNITNIFLSLIPFKCKNPTENFTKPMCSAMLLIKFQQNQNHYSSPPLSLWAHLILIPPVILFFCHPAIATATFHCLLLSIPSLTGCTSPGASYSFLFLFWNFFIEVWLTQQKLYIFNVQNSMHWEISVHRRCRRCRFDP